MSCSTRTLIASACFFVTLPRRIVGRLPSVPTNRILFLPFVSVPIVAIAVFALTLLRGFSLSQFEFEVFRQSIRHIEPEGLLARCEPANGSGLQARQF